MLVVCCVYTYMRSQLFDNHKHNKRVVKMSVSDWPCPMTTPICHQNQRSHPQFNFLRDSPDFNALACKDK